MIFIKGMKMPRDCIECRFFEISDEYCYARGAYGSEWGKSTGCPLVEIPPHGRLIDADALHYSRVRIYHEDGIVGGYNAVVMSAEIKDAPTIIEAEGVKE